MLIKKIKIKNFRQYYGTHEIEFSCDKEKNVTLFLGDNGTGKTSISQAFLWCLYGETPAFKKKELFSEKKEEEMHGGRENMSVTIEMEHANIEYTITRTQSIKKEDGKIKLDQPMLEIVCIRDGETKFLTPKERETCVEEILPQQLSQYFFLSGEKIGDMSSDIRVGKAKDFRNAVTTLLELNHFESAIKHLQNISKSYDTSSVEGFAEDLKILNSKIESANTNISTFEETKIEAEKSIEYITNAIIEIKAQLKSMKDSGDIQQAKENEERKLNDANGAIQYEQKSAIKEFVNKAPYFFAQMTMRDTLQTLKEATKTSPANIPEKLHADLIDWIENKAECVCGTKIHEGDEHWQLLEKWRSIVPPENIGNVAQSMETRVLDKYKLGSELLEHLKSKKKTIEDKEDTIEECKDKIEKYEQELLAAEDTSSLQKNLSVRESELKEARREKNDAEEFIRKCEQEKKTRLTEREKLIESSKEGKRILKWKKMTDRLLEMFRNEYEKDEIKKRTQLVDAVKKAFSTIYGNTLSLKIDEEYRIKMNTDLETSTGQSMSVIFAFLAGLLEVIKTNKDDDNKENRLESYPLVLDAPFSVFDKQRIASISKVLPKVSEQVIIFIKDTDGNIAKENMKDKIGKSYNLIKQDSSEQWTKILEEK